MKMKYISLWVILMVVLMSCYEDKGNYSYSEMEKITITIPEDMKAMGNIDYISFTPSVVSSLKGEIAENDQDYEFGCKILYEYKDPLTGATSSWTNINPEKKKGIHYFATFPAKDYAIWYTVTNKKTNVTTSVQSSVKVLSSTYEGWMVLTEIGSDSRVALDMISEDAQGNNVIARDIWSEEAPKLYNAYALPMIADKLGNHDDGIFVMTRSGSYRLNTATLQLTEGNNMKYTDFMSPEVLGSPLSMSIVNNANTNAPTSLMTVTDQGNAYAITSGGAGAVFENPLNTDVTDGVPKYRVSHMTGTSMVRPGNSTCALLYDIDNKKFLGWKFDASNNHILMQLTEPEGIDRKFSYTTGMTLVTMESTLFSNGLVYSVLQDEQNKRCVYGINLSTSKFTQESVYKNIAAEHFNDATDYAFHSQYSQVFYCYGNKVYSCNLVSGTLNNVLTLDEGETVTMVKFNLFVNPDLTFLNNTTPEFLSKQHDLIVGSTTGVEDGGIVRILSIDSDGKMTKKEEYKGLGRKIVDVTYRERRNK